MTVQKTSSLSTRTFDGRGPTKTTTTAPPFLRIALISVALLSGASVVSAAGNDGMGVYVQGGHNFAHGTDTDNVFIGVTVPFHAPHQGIFGTSISSYWEGYIGQWRGPEANGGDKTYTNVAASFVGRMRFSEGRSPWFTEASIGLSYLDDIYTKPGRSFSTRLNFTERFGIGRSFGARDEHELSLNYQHFSNAGIKKPNPGEDFVQIRYAYKF